MNLRDATSVLRSIAFRFLRVLASLVPASRIAAFGPGDEKIGAILVINLDRQPNRWLRVIRELSRFRSHDGTPLVKITRRLAAVDAGDGRAVAATADVDPVYRMADQLFVQPDAILAASFGVDEPIRMTRQEVAVARSHIECWKRIVAGTDEHVLVLEDDVWFRPGAARAIDRGWRAALERCGSSGPRFLYFSYSDAAGTAERVDIGDDLFRPVRGLWFLSGYVLSRDGAAMLLRAMPVVGPVDLWMNYRLAELEALALSSPAILQREDLSSDNSYSILPYLARAGIVDAGSGRMKPEQPQSGLILAWSAGGTHDQLAMALSMLGRRVITIDENCESIGADRLAELGRVFDAIVDAPLSLDALSAIKERADVKFLVESGTTSQTCSQAALPSTRTKVLSADRMKGGPLWSEVCSFLGCSSPAEAFPVGPPREWRTFGQDVVNPSTTTTDMAAGQTLALDDSPWVLPPHINWRPRPIGSTSSIPALGKIIIPAECNVGPPAFVHLNETFPGNLASFSYEGIVRSSSGTSLVVSESAEGNRRYRSGAFASTRAFGHGRFEAEIKAARGPGLVTGFFLHRPSPRQEIDIELPGNDPQRMLVNVYFNPGDEGAELGFGYRGSPYLVDLGFDAALDFHKYAIEWRPGRITWLVDGKILHERFGWDPTPIPHLPMRLHANLWVPRSEELAGKLEVDALPTSAIVRNMSVTSFE